MTSMASALHVLHTATKNRNTHTHMDTFLAELSRLHGLRLLVGSSLGWHLRPSDGLLGPQEREFSNGKAYGHSNFPFLLDGSSIKPANPC